jgi:hypothetical protein
MQSLSKNLETRYSINEEPDDDDPHKHSKTSFYYNLCNSLKAILLKALSIYDKKHVTVEQKESSLVSILITNFILNIHSNLSIKSTVICSFLYFVLSSVRK